MENLSEPLLRVYDVDNDNSEPIVADNVFSDSDIKFAPSQTAASRERAPRFRQILATLLSSFAPLSFGLVLGYSSPTNIALIQEGILDVNKKTWFASIPTLGALLGGVVGGFFMNKFGRKGTLIACGIPFVIGWLMIISVQMFKSFFLLLAGRFVCGITMGVVCLVCPTYVAEIASPDMRGALGTIFQINTTVGILLAFLLGTFISWEWLAVFSSIVAVLSTVCMIFAPESPRHFAASGLDTQALESLRWLRGAKYSIETELDDINAHIEHNPNSSFSLKDFTSKSIYKPVLLTLCLMVFQQCSGINDVIFYATNIFKSAKFEGNEAIPGIIVAAVQVVATTASVFMIDRLGRKILLCISGSFMTIGCITLGVNYFLQAHEKQAGISWLPIASLVLYVAAFSVGWGPIPWMAMPELIPARVKGFASGLAVITNWFSAFLVTKEFDDLENGIQQYGTFWLFAGINILGVIFVALLLPETKGKSLEEIERHFSSR